MARDELVPGHRGATRASIGGVLSVLAPLRADEADFVCGSRVELAGSGVLPPQVRWGNGLALGDALDDDLYVAYEQQSGEALVVYGKGDTSVYHRTWNGLVWSGEGSIAKPGDAAGSMLDHTMVLYGSGMNNGVGIEDGKGSHSTRKLPILLAGGGKLGIKQGQHLVYEKDRTPLCNLHVTLMQSMGLERAQFVDGTGRLTGLS